jgi:hypothetical protein
MAHRAIEPGDQCKGEDCNAWVVTPNKEDMQVHLTPCSEDFLHSDSVFCRCNPTVEENRYDLVVHNVIGNAMSLDTYLDSIGLQKRPSRSDSDFWSILEA